MSFGRCAYGVQWYIVLHGSPGSLRERGGLVSNPQPKHSVANCSQTISPMLPPDQCKREVGWTCRSDSAFCQVIKVLVFLCVCDRIKDEGAVYAGKTPQRGWCRTCHGPINQRQTAVRHCWDWRLRTLDVIWRRWHLADWTGNRTSLLLITFTRGPRRRTLTTIPPTHWSVFL